MFRSTIRIATYAVFVAFCFIILSGVATAATSVSILPSSQTVVTGEDFTLQVYIEPDTAIYGLQLDLSYDNSLVTINSIEEGNFFASSNSPVMFNSGNIDESTGTVSQIYGALIMGDGIINEGIFCTINLEAKSDYGPCQLRITDFVLGDEQGKELPVTTFDSIISITDSSGTFKEINDNNKDADESELNIIPAQDDDIESLNSEQNSINYENEEMMLASTPDQAEDDIIEAKEPGFDNSKISNWITLIMIAIAFLGIAYFLDRKK
ncbi:cohesin domain-containing protein [Methanolobus mangrovi]|uniref:Cohesin domain-containing protein n=1 Tax=Methanolobus mangrovi TaxID=3072977 RepID=A0AA51UG68_9EURY|nr:cohesin domain-containing protein [Methanolobus mangrovi]WMW22540.1 cohesin domain-containing protein [Methanolobus mangrovi]